MSYLDPPVVHWDAQAPPSMPDVYTRHSIEHISWNHPACGVAMYYGGSALLTRNPELVTCKSCTRTRSFKEVAG